jgi:predicted RNA-binding Zn-ribbon protein involved in translation (DUF1610 family)
MTCFGREWFRCPKCGKRMRAGMVQCKVCRAKEYEDKKKETERRPGA